jgi:hypothetical protein
MRGAGCWARPRLQRREQAAVGALVRQAQAGEQALEHVQARAVAGRDRVVVYVQGAPRPAALAATGRRERRRRLVRPAGGAAERAQQRGARARGRRAAHHLAAVLRARGGPARERVGAAHTNAWAPLSDLATASCRCAASVVAEPHMRGRPRG